MDGIDINEIIKSAYNTVLETQQAATETIGTSCLWARATPVINSEDVILQEYTLTQVGLECPQMLKVVVSNTDYNPGEYTIDLYGLNYVQPLEINITIQEWNNIYGQTTMPQKGDIVYVQIYHKLFEVQSSELIYSLAAMPTYYKVILSKYSPTSSRKETEEFRQSVEDLTVSQEELFGEIISEEVADNNATNETAYNNTTYVDPFKTFDIDSIVPNAIHGTNNNLISNAYYDFSKASTNIIYKSDMIYELNASRNHLIFSCWFKNEMTNIKQSKIKALIFHSKDTSYWYFRISTLLKLSIGDDITITRGALLKVSGTIIKLDCKEGYGVAIKVSDMTRANKKLTRWFENCSVLKIYKLIKSNLLKGFDENDKQVFDITYKTNEMSLQIGDNFKSFNIELNLNLWNYIMFDISTAGIRLVISELKINELNKQTDHIIYDQIVPMYISDFTVNEFHIENMGMNTKICNIRLYENEYEMGDQYKYDMYSPVTENASKLILVDSPNDPIKLPFISPVR